MRKLVLTFVLFLLSAGAAFAATETVNPPILNQDGSVGVCITEQGAMQAILDANKAIPGLHLSMFKWQEILLDSQGHNPQDQFRMWGCYHVAADVVAKAMRPGQSPGRNTQTLTNAQTTTVAATKTAAVTPPSPAPTNQSAQPAKPITLANPSVQPASTSNTINDFLNCKHLSDVTFYNGLSRFQTPVQRCLDKQDKADAEGAKRKAQQDALAVLGAKITAAKNRVILSEALYSSIILLTTLLYLILFRRVPAYKHIAAIIKPAGKKDHVRKTTPVRRPAALHTYLVQTEHFVHPLEMAALPEPTGENGFDPYSFKRDVQQWLGKRVPEMCGLRLEAAGNEECFTRLLVVCALEDAAEVETALGNMPTNYSITFNRCDEATPGEKIGGERLVFYRVGCREHLSHSPQTAYIRDKEASLGPQLVSAAS